MVCNGMAEDCEGSMVPLSMGGLWRWTFSMHVMSQFSSCSYDFPVQLSSMLDYFISSIIRFFSKFDARVCLV